MCVCVYIYIYSRLRGTILLSRIDYYSSILIMIPLSSISPLNRVIRSSIRKTYNLRILDNSSTSSYLHSFHLTNDPLISYYYCSSLNLLFELSLLFLPL